MRACHVVALGLLLVLGSCSAGEISRATFNTIVKDFCSGEYPITLNEASVPPQCKTGSAQPIYNCAKSFALKLAPQGSGCKVTLTPGNSSCPNGAGTITLSAGVPAFIGHFPYSSGSIMFQAVDITKSSIDMSIMVPSLGSCDVDYTVGASTAKLFGEVAGLLDAAKVPDVNVTLADFERVVTTDCSGTYSVTVDQASVPNECTTGPAKKIYDCAKSFTLTATKSGPTSCAVTLTPTALTTCGVGNATLGLINGEPFMGGSFPDNTTFTVNDFQGSTLDVHIAVPDVGDCSVEYKWSVAGASAPAATTTMLGKLANLRTASIVTPAAPTTKPGPAPGAPSGSASSSVVGRMLMYLAGAAALLGMLVA